MKTKVFIDVAALAEPRLSGIGHLVMETTRALSESVEFLNSYELILVIPKNGWDKIRSRGLKNVSYKVIPFRAVVLSALERFHLLPPMDMILGRGIYVFPNYKNWPLLKSKSITYVHDLVFMRYPEFVESRNLKTLNSGVHRWVKRSDLIATISNFSKKEIKELLDVADERIVVLYCGVNTNKFKRVAGEKIDSFRNKHNLPKDYILYLGNLEPRKNISNLVEAYVNLPQKLKDKHALLLVGGDGWSNEELLTKIATEIDNGNNIIRPNEYITDEELPTLFSGASMLVQPSIYEGFGLSPLQAMACKTPILVSKTASLPEVCGSAASYIEPKDVTGLSGGIEELLTNNDLREKRIINGLKRARKLSWNDTATGIKRTLDSLGAG